MRLNPLNSKKATSPEKALKSPFIKEVILRELIAAGATPQIMVEGRKGGFGMRISFGNRTSVLTNIQGHPRVFASLTTIAVLLRRIGSPKFTVDMSEYTPGLVRKAQPARAAAMKRGEMPKAASPADVTDGAGIEGEMGADSASKSEVFRGRRLLRVSKN